MPKNDGKLREWCVTIPLAGSASTMVEARSEEEAIERAWELFENSSSFGDDFNIEYELMPRTCQGNVNYTPCWQQSAEPGCLLEDGTDDGGTQTGG